MNMYGTFLMPLPNMAGNGNEVHVLDPFLTAPVQNPNVQPLPYPDYNVLQVPIVPKQEMSEETTEVVDGSEQVEATLSGEEQEHSQQSAARSRSTYHRHSARQIRELEAVFQQNPHPDEKVKARLSRDLGLRPSQVKFWFQNRRTQQKASQERAAKAVLMAENDKLKQENLELQAAVHHVACVKCGGPIHDTHRTPEEEHLRAENARLRAELEQVSGMTSCFGKTFKPSGAALFPAGGSLMIGEEQKTIALKLAMSSLTELLKMCVIDEPLWVRLTGCDKEVLDTEEYRILFPWPMSLNQHPGDQLRTEASRGTAVVMMNGLSLVEAFMDADKWMQLFPSIISNAKTVQVICPGASGYPSGYLQLMYAEFVVPTPLVPTREVHFLRYCLQNTEDTWAIVDFPLESLKDSCFSVTFPLYRRLPSGCIIQDISNGCSKVTWVEHAEVADLPMHPIFYEYVVFGMAFGAQRWLAVLQRQCQKLACQMGRDITNIGGLPSMDATTKVMNLAERMTRMFCVSLSSSNGQSWTSIDDSRDDTVRITTKGATEAGVPNSLILSGVCSIWLPYNHNQVFGLLRDENRRAQMALLLTGNSLQVVARIATGSHPGNCISLHNVMAVNKASDNQEFMLQESCIDESGSLVTFAIFNSDAMQQMMNGEDPSHIPVLPLGFVIVPFSRRDDAMATTRAGCLLTIGVQVVAATSPSGRLNASDVTTVNNLLCEVKEKIYAAFGNGSSSSGSGSGSDAVVDDQIIGGSSMGSLVDPPTAPGWEKEESGSASACTNTP